MRPTLYIETSIISYLAANPSRDLITAAHQQTTHTWWRERRQDFNLYVSQVVLDEAAAGDPEVAKRRMELLKGVPLLDPIPEAADLTTALIGRLNLPTRAGADAAHIAVAACHNMNFLLTWNCTHIANAELRPRIERICREKGYAVPILCTPDELMGEFSNEG
jgi:hypothetical protein